MNLDCRTNCWYITHMSQFNKGFFCLGCLLFYEDFKIKSKSRPNLESSNLFELPSL